MNINRFKPLFILGFILLLAACGGGGGGTVPQFAGLELSTQGTTTAKLGTIDVTFPLPQDVTVTNVSLATVVGQGFPLNWSVTPASGTSPAKLTLTVVSSNLDGFPRDAVFATVNLSLSNGKVPTVADFTPVDSFIARDLTGTPLPSTDISMKFTVVNVR